MPLTRYCRSYLDCCLPATLSPLCPLPQPQLELRAVFLLKLFAISFLQRMHGLDCAAFFFFAKFSRTTDFLSITSALRLMSSLGKSAINAVVTCHIPSSFVAFSYLTIFVYFRRMWALAPTISTMPTTGTLPTRFTTWLLR
jgi:hypothetical protein